MRAIVGKAVRGQLFSTIEAALPGMVRLKQWPQPWVWGRRTAELREWIWYQQNNYDDSFTLELSWSMVTDDPFAPRMKAPTEPYTAEGRRFRVGALFTDLGDFWWRVCPPKPDLLGIAPEEAARLMMDRPVYSEAELPVKATQAVTAAREVLHEKVAPHLDTVRVWAGVAPVIQRGV